MSGDTTFSAADSALGYLYQCRLALVCALRRLRANEEFQLALETLDDVVFEREGQADDLLQAKHHRERSANLTDASSDLWKTLRIWCEGITTGVIPADATLYLVTTSTASGGHAAAYLRMDGRDTQQAAVRLRATAETSTSQTNAAAYAAFRVLSADQQRSLLDRVFVLDAFPNIIEIDEELRRQVRLSVQREHLEPFLVRLEGWWLRRAIQQLSDPDADRVLSEEFEDATALM